MEFTVESKHINGAVRKSACACPVARALNERYGYTWSVKIFGGGGVAFQWPGKLYYLTTKTVEFINDFDNGKPVSSDTFSLLEECPW